MSTILLPFANADVMYDEIADEELDLHGDDSYIYGEDYDDDGIVEVYAPTDVPPPEYNPEAEITEDRLKENEIG